MDAHWQQPAIPIKATAVPLGGGPRQVNILIVDDEPQNLTALETVLDDAHYRLVRATSADEALLALVAEEFALLILDIQMPDMNGFELAQLIKRRKKSANIPIIFLTAYYSEDEHILQGYKTGAVDYLHKPINPSILRSKAAVFAELHSKTQEISAINASLAVEVAQRRTIQDQLLLLNESLEDRIRERTRDLQASESRKDAILNSALDAIVTIDYAGRLVEFNPAAERMFGHERGAALGRPLEDLLVPELPRDGRCTLPMEELLSGQSELLNRRTEHSAVRADGTRFPAELAVVRVSSVDPPMFTAFLRDITERKCTEAALAKRVDELARADRNKDEFLAMLAHELRNPLAPLSNAAEILIGPDSTSGERTEAEKVLERQIRKMARMIDDLLDVSRITQGKIELNRERVLLAPIMESAANLVRPACTSNEQHLSLSLPAAPIVLEADATRLEQVLSNLLGNACKYSGHGSRIWLAAEKVGGPDSFHVEICVRDDGEGIEPDLLPSIFDLFVQASRSMDRSQGGLGIGLTLVQRMVKLHGGSVEARSEGLGKGAQFIVRLPILAGEPPRPSIAESARRPQASRRILIVDDNADAARTLAILHVRHGHTVRTAFTGQEAVATAAEYLPEVVLLDIGLPGMDGLEVARQLRSNAATAKALIVAMSGYGRNQDIEAALAAGIDEYLVKPVDMDRLHAFIATCSEHVDITHDMSLECRFPG